MIALQLIPNYLKLGAQTAQINPEKPDLSNLLDEYQKFADMFDKQCSRLLPRHYPYDLSIQTEKRAILFLEPIYSLLVLELQTLKEFLDENLKTGIICPLQFSGGALVLFVKKKNGALQLYVDSRRLNYII